MIRNWHIRSRVTALREKADLAFVHDALLAEIHVADQREANLVEGVPEPWQIEVGFLAAKNVAKVFQRVWLTTHEKVIERDRTLRVVPVKGVRVESYDLHIVLRSWSE